MLINAQPRFVSNGFETFVPAQRSESLHQRLGEMTSNDVNAWNIPGPVATFSTESWDQQLDDYTSNENLPLQTLYAGYFQGGSNQTYNQAVNYQKDIPEYTAVHPGHYQLPKKTLATQQIYQELVPDMRCFEEQSPMLGNVHPRWSIGGRNGSFAEFSSSRNAPKSFSYSSSTDTDLSAALAPQQTRYQEDALAIGGCMNANRTSPRTIYSCYSSVGPSVDPMSLTCPSVSTTNDISAKTQWWQENSRGNKGQYQNFSAPLTHDGLPRSQSQQSRQQYDNLWGSWGSGDGSAANWVNEVQPVAPATISPKLLTFNVQSATIPSSGSSEGSVKVHLSPGSTASSGSNSDEDHIDNFSTPEKLNIIVPIRRHRHLLPDSIPIQKRVAPVVPSNTLPSKRATRKRPLRSSDSHHRETSSTAHTGGGQTEAVFTKATQPARTPLPNPKRIESKPASPSVQQSWADKPQSAATIQAMHHRDVKDDFLVRSKLAGMSYKDIRRQGKFIEAESTLRGRFRTLTKHKTARVRKPEWGDNDIRLLRKAVKKLTANGDSLRGKVPWKQVAEYIANNGGSYHFGNATCRKKWDELHVRP